MLSDTFGPDDIRPKIFNLWKRISETGESIDMSLGEQLIDVTYIEDVIAAFVRLLELLSDEVPCITNGAQYGVCYKTIYIKRIITDI